MIFHSSINIEKITEDNRREVKKANGGLPVSLWDTYSSFANCYGGVIILGIKEEKDGSKSRFILIMIFLMGRFAEIMKAITIVPDCK